MEDLLMPTIGELIKRRIESLMVSEKAIIANPDAYRQIKRIVRHVIAKPIDIGDYYATAKKLASLLKIMTESGHGSIFHYYYAQIDPQQTGRARFFRADCMDLEEQLRCVDQLRLRKHRLRIIH